MTKNYLTMNATRRHYPTWRYTRITLALSGRRSDWQDTCAHDARTENLHCKGASTGARNFQTDSGLGFENKPHAEVGGM